MKLLKLNDRSVEREELRSHARKTVMGDAGSDLQILKRVGCCWMAALASLF